MGRIIKIIHNIRSSLSQGCRFCDCDAELLQKVVGAEQTTRVELWRLDKVHDRGDNFQVVAGQAACFFLHRVIPTKRVSKHHTVDQLRQLAQLVEYVNSMALRRCLLMIAIALGQIHSRCCHQEDSQQDWEKLHPGLCIRRLPAQLVVFCFNVRCRLLQAETVSASGHLCRMPCPRLASSGGLTWIGALFLVSCSIG